jgi:hypothetical protein
MVAQISPARIASEPSWRNWNEGDKDCDVRLQVLGLAALAAAGLGPAVNWMAANFTGLAAGTYTYQLTGPTSFNWTNINSFLTNWTGTLVIPEESVVGAPEPMTLPPLGTGLAELRRRLNHPDPP